MILGTILVRINLIILFIKLASSILIYIFFFLDLGACVIPIYTSIFWLLTNQNDFFLISFSCLLMDFKFLLFFRAFESFGVYFIIIFNVAKKIASFLVVVFIILMSFAHAFLIILRPRSLSHFPTFNDDPNNPWNLGDVYYSINDNRTIGYPSLVQAPSEDFNVFTDFGNSLFAMYLYFTGTV